MSWIWETELPRSPPSNLEAASSSYLEAFAESVELPVGGLRLLLSLLAAYPIVLFHRHYLYYRSLDLQHLYFILTGFSLAFFNYGYHAIHSALCIFFTWAFLHVNKGNPPSIIVSVVFLMLYLLKGFYNLQVKSFSNDATYTFAWTLPHSVLTLRLMGLVFDIENGGKDPRQLTSTQKSRALKFVPNLIEVAASVYFPGYFLIGPQLSMKQYLNFSRGNVVRRYPPGCVNEGLLRGLSGLILLPVFFVCHYEIPFSFFESPVYNECSLAKKYLIVGVWGNLNLLRYISVWLLAEGACIMSGIACSDLDSKGQIRWNDCENVNLVKYIFCTQLRSYVEFFNIQTNEWVKEYVYRRVKLYAGVTCAQAAALFFLAIWHGFHSGYYHFFALEFITVSFEYNVHKILKRHQFFSSYFNNFPVKCILRIYVFIATGYVFGPFLLMTKERWIKFYNSLNYLGHHFFLLGWAVANIINNRLPSYQEE